MNLREMNQAYSLLEVTIMMEGPMFGIIVLVAMILGLGWWIWHSLRKDKKQ